MKRGLGKRGEGRLLDERPVAHSFNFRRRSERIKKFSLIQYEYVSPTKEVLFPSLKHVLHCPCRVTKE